MIKIREQPKLNLFTFFVDRSQMEDLPIFDSNDILQDDGRESQRKQKEFLSGSPTQTKHSKHTFSDLELQDPLSLPPTRKFGGWGQDGVASGQAAYGR
ncbi:hypothetical protein D915_008034 [Fasciola hepatica]|uniref:Uncharacterized protein n=1 Tax=Fasciola hepatica TaxID=6192 RepID=A0A4E0R4Z1_FASHE|nr:hypothetical protein D915_008034 [Fasciola hepatica]